MHWGTVAEWAMALFAAATALLAFSSYRSSKQVEWLMGALESHSTTRVRMQAKRDGLKVKAYDPKDSRYPGRIPLLGEEWHLDEVHLALPREFRRRSQFRLW
jgi:hypothetical protein